MGHKARKKSDRVSWVDADNTPLLDQHLTQLDHFVDALADGRVDTDELAKQEKNLVKAMKAIEDDLSDKQHARVTKLLVELTAYNIMQTLHGLAAERMRRVVE